MTYMNASQHLKTTALLLGSVLILSACVEGEGFNPFKPRVDSAVQDAAAQSRTRTVERDVEAPEVFEKNERGLWDGRPSLGGIWIAHEDVAEPSRVIIRNDADGKFVVGALFRRERITPGPEFQVSSEAAAALGMLAGQPTALSVVALRREEITEEIPESTIEAGETQTAILPTDTIETTPLDPIAAAAAAIDLPAGPETAVAAIPAGETATVAASTLSKPFIQIGIFSIEANANKTAQDMRATGLAADVRSLTSNGREFWRVIVGPATSSSDRSELLEKVKGLGFADAYFVRG